MLNKDHQPTDREILEAIGEAGAWLELKQYLESAYEFTPELVDYGKYGWTIRYRKGGKTLVSLFPEKGAFTALIVLGKKETENALSAMNQFNTKMRKLFDATKQLHDGRWLWIRVRKQSDIKGIKKLLKLKRKPRI